MPNIKDMLSIIKEGFQEISSNYSDLKSNVQDEIGFEFLEDVSKGVKILNAGRKYFQTQKFISFLNGLCYADKSSKKIDQLIQYMEKDNNVMFVTNTIDKIILSNSQKSCFIMGLLLSDLLKYNGSVTQKELVLLQLLSEINDFDLYNYSKLYENSYVTKSNKRLIKYSTVSDCSKKYNINRENLFITIEMLTKNYAINKISDVELSIDSDDVEFSTADVSEEYLITSIGEELLKLINIIEQ